MAQQGEYTRERYTDEFRTSYEQSPYFKAGNTWDDYEPAFRYSYDRYTSDLRGRRWDDVERDMEGGWERAKTKSRLAWADARDAVKAGWHKLEQAMPGDADRDGR